MLDVGAEAVKAADEVRAPVLEAAQIGAELHQVALRGPVVPLGLAFKPLGAAAAQRRAEHLG